MNGIEVLLNYLKKYKNEEENLNNDENVINLIDNIIETINERRYLVDFDVFEKLVKKYEKSDIDNILNDIILNVNRYNIYLMNKKIKFALPILDNDIPLDDVKIDISDILNYLDVSDSEIDKRFLKEKDIKKFIDKDKFQDFAKTVKTSNELERVLFDKIEDKNVLISILLHSDIETIRNVINVFKEREVNINKVVVNIPSIFIKNVINNSCKYDVLCNYNDFMDDEYKIDFKRALKFPVFFINDVKKNKELLDKLIEVGVKPANVLEYAGNILVLKPEIVFNNINTLKFHGVEFTDDENNNGYTILGMTNLDERIDYLIEKELWKNE